MIPVVRQFMEHATFYKKYITSVGEYTFLRSPTNFSNQVILLRYARENVFDIVNNVPRSNLEWVEFLGKDITTQI